MRIYPAIDLLGGKCVRLRQGDYDAVTVFDEDPVAMARRWQTAGAQALHVVDLDGARAGSPAQLEIASAIAHETGLPVQLGGGLRTVEDVERAFAAGMERVILGTAAVRDAATLATCLARWDERIVVSLDARGDAVTVAGWLESADESLTDAAVRMVHAGVWTLIVTDVERDGTLAGSPSPRLLRLRAQLPQVALVAAGGIANIEDVRRLARAEIDGAILGRALYAGTIDLAEALRVAAKPLPSEAVSKGSRIGDLGREEEG